MPSKLGQNFLTDKFVLARIIQFANLNSNDLVVEVGPGEGILTEELILKTKKVLAIEIDSILARKLASRLHKKTNLEIINADILKINLPELIQANTPKQIPPKQYKLIANIPYYITSPIIRLFLETKYPPEEMLLMIQKEVAERICAKPGKLSVLALSVQYYAIPELLFTVPKTAFSPIPEVDSAVIRITKKQGLTHNTKEVKNFFRVVKAGFSAKRKTLANNLSSSLQLEKASVEKKLAQMNITPNQRAQELSLEDWQKLSVII